MSLSIVDGTIEATELARAPRRLVRFKSMTIREQGGGMRQLRNAMATAEVGERLTPGTSGRFYLFSTIDIKGIHGVRLADGEARYGFPGSFNLKLFAILVLLNLFWIGLRLAMGDGIPIIAIPLLLLGVAGWVLTRSAASRTRRHFDEDARQTGAAMA